MNFQIPGLGTEPQIVTLYLIYMALSAAVQSLEPPSDKSGPPYRFIFRFLNLIVCDFKSFAAKPGPRPDPTQPNQTETK